MNQEDVRATVEKALNELGATSESVAQKLREHDVRGTPASASSCPIARYVHDTVLHGAYQVSVPGDGVRVVIPLDDDDDMTNIFVHAPPAVENFISEFDSGEHFRDMRHFR